MCPAPAADSVKVVQNASNLQHHHPHLQQQQRQQINPHQWKKVQAALPKKPPTKMKPLK